MIVLFISESELKMADENRELPPLRLTLSDLRKMRMVLLAYSTAICIVVPSLPNRNKLLDTIGKICEHIGLLTLPGEAESYYDFVLSPDELTIVDSAFTTYIASFRQSMLESSEGHDDVIRQYEAIREYIISGCTPPDISP